MDVLYKYVASAGAARAIAGGSLKFTPPAELNDPAELVPLMNREAVATSLADLRKSGFNEEQFRWLGHQEAILRLLSPETRILSRPVSIKKANETLRYAFYDDLDAMEHALLRTIGLIRSRVGVLSLTERFDSLPMWAHYGALAAGYIVRLEGLGAAFAGDDTGSLNVLKPVKYVIDLLGLTHDPVTQDNLFFCKFADWSYEREWRVVSALSQCIRVDERRMHLRSVDKRAVTAVICGWNVPAEQARQLAHELVLINPGLEVLTARFKGGRIEIGPLER